MKLLSVSPQKRKIIYYELAKGFGTYGSNFRSPRQYEKGICFHLEEILGLEYHYSCDDSRPMVEFNMFGVGNIKDATFDIPYFDNSSHRCFAMLLCYEMINYKCKLKKKK